MRLSSIASFLHPEGLTVPVPGLGEVVVDVAYGGNFDAIVDPQAAIADTAEVSAADLLRRALDEKHGFQHPEKPEIPGLSYMLSTGRPTQPTGTACNAVLYGNKAIDRRPCGTGTSARMAQRAAKGRLSVGDNFIHGSIAGSRFSGQAAAATRLGGRSASVRSIAGWSQVTGLNTAVINGRDPFAHGLQVNQGAETNENHCHSGLSGRSAAERGPVQLVERQLCRCL